MRMFWTSDHHFGHAKILKYQADTRPYADLRAMHNAYITQWNSQVGPDDVVYHLGDVCLGGYHDCTTYLGKLNGKILLVPGNHDKWLRDNGHRMPISASGYQVQLLPQIHVMHHDGQTIVLCHYPLRSWPHSFYDAWHLYGHTHGAVIPWGLSMDVGVDPWRGRLCTWEDLVQSMSKIKQRFQEPKINNKEVEDDHEP